MNNALLHGTLTKEVYMAQPLGFVDSQNSNLVFHLHKALYGLEQAIWASYHKLKKYLLIVSFTNSVANSSLFVYNISSFTSYLLVYIDDIIITENNDDLLECIVDDLANKFSIKDLGTLLYFLGVEVISCSFGLLLT